MGASATRQQIVDVADRLFRERGYEATSFADIASDVGLSRGNFYYHFKTKDAILAAVIERRLEATAVLLAVWEQESGSPAERIRSFVNILVSNRTAIMAHGCPVGTLCSELAKLEHVARDDAARLFSLFRDWLAQQFIALGRPADAEALALHLLMRSQGVATLATAFRDEGFIRREVAEMNAWLDAQCPSASSSCRTS
ncbi:MULTISPECIES: TetR family transcriptional regulator [unclassified Bosea (in: a-proteobacteria)]|uniref:TetR/AcrR family transcriptional regulator n=1 Tax=unclassified Bosea (in: a-proteobacteria) TaxID=2653178 RepID=UPI0009553E3B|nr:MULTISPECIES: TetR family transcriptional regulator [unclassified Bosea (in: a-proteobacteria)]TAJ33297.1 MAG: TetR family transcriptional regulator [Bosea sp. (in: a-proteobacteria)]SIQ46131.1 transcriptional regulator, TetR family [Bosea sp. TND4EK4]